MISLNACSRIKAVSFLLYLLITIGACKKTGAGESVTAKGYATGKVIDTYGNPIQGVEVVVNNSLIGNNNPAGVTDVNGNYKIKLPTVGTFHTSASFRKVFNGKTYTLDLHPDSFDEFSNEGAVRNFQWKLTGQRKTVEEGYYGGSIGFNTGLGSLISEYQYIEFTLVPQGKLIDGSAGQTVQMKCGQPYTADYGHLRNIPIGRYKISAVYRENGTSTPLRIRYLLAEENTYTNELVLDFEPQMLSGTNHAEILCKEN